MLSNYGHHLVTTTTMNLPFPSRKDTETGLHRGKADQLQIDDANLRTLKRNGQCHIHGVENGFWYV